MLQTYRKCILSIWGIDIFGNILTHSINSIRLIDQNGRNVTFFVNSSFVDENLDIDSHIWFVNFAFSFHHNYHQSQQWKFRNSWILSSRLNQDRSIDDLFVHFFFDLRNKTMVQLWCPCCCFQLNHHSLIKINECISLLYQTFWWFNLASWSSSSLGEKPKKF